MRDLKKLYVVINNEEVIFFATNLSSFYRKIVEQKYLENSIKSEATLRRYFAKNKKITLLGTNKKIYTLQRLL